MPQPKRPSTVTSHPSRHIKLRIFLISFAVLAVAGVIAVVINHDKTQKTLAADQARFIKVDKNLSQINHDLQQSSSPPISTAKKDGCDRPSHEYSEGPLSCDTGYIWIYSVASSIEANRLKQEISNTISQNIKSSQNIPSISNFDALLSEPYYQQLKQRFYDTDAKMNCSLYYTFFAKGKSPYPEFNFPLATQYGEGVKLSCGDFALNNYFKMRKN